MNIRVIGGETLGNRSLSVYVECSDLNILIDPGVALGYRFNLLPHPLEYISLIETRKEIENVASHADLIFISHYHYDHFTPFWDEIDNLWTFADSESAKKIYSGKRVLLKNPFENINLSQKNRASQFLSRVKRIASKVEIADSKILEEDKVKLRVSAPMPHGEEGTPLGYVLMLCIEDKGDKFLFASDVEGPISQRVLDEIIRIRPNYLMISGPPLYLLDTKLTRENFSSAILNLEKVTANVEVLILDHHLLRSEESLKYIKALKEVADSNGSLLLTRSEFAGKETKMLEANRKKLYEEISPSSEFLKWTKNRKGLPPLDKSF